MVLYFNVYSIIGLENNNGPAIGVILRYIVKTQYHRVQRNFFPRGIPKNYSFHRILEWAAGGGWLLPLVRGCLSCRRHDDVKSGAYHKKRNEDTDSRAGHAGTGSYVVKSDSQWDDLYIEWRILFVSNRGWLVNLNGNRCSSVRVSTPTGTHGEK